MLISVTYINVQIGMAFSYTSHTEPQKASFTTYTGIIFNVDSLYSKPGLISFDNNSNDNHYDQVIFYPTTAKPWASHLDLRIWPLDE